MSGAPAMALRPAHRADEWDSVWSDDPYGGNDAQAARARGKAAALTALGIEVRDGARVLDLACGSGHTLTELAGRTPRRARWIGSDRSAVAERRSWSRLRQSAHDAHVLQADAMDLPFHGAAFDVVLAVMVLHHVHEPQRVLAEIDRVLAADGRLFAVVPNPFSLASVAGLVRRSARRWPYDTRTYTAAQLLGPSERTIRPASRSAGCR